MKRNLTFLVAAILMLIPASAFAVDISQMTGWPVNVSASPYFSDMHGFVMADIDGDEDLEIIVATSGQQVHAFNHDGTTIFTVNLSGLSTGPAAIGDVTGDELPEIVVGTRDVTGGTPTPKVYVISNTGSILEQAATPHGGAISSAPTLANLDADDKLEIIVGEHGSSSGWLYALDGDLQVISGWPADLDHVPATSAAAGDIDDDGQIEIVVCSFYSVYAFEANGTALSGFPITLTDETYSYGGPALADLNDDNKLEIMVTSHGTYNNLHVFKYDGSELTGFPYSLGDAWSFSSPSVADIDQNGDLEIIVGRAGGTIADDNLFVINDDGTDLTGFPYNMVGGAEGNFAVADIAGDANLEILFTNNISDGNGYLFAIDNTANLMDGWPVRPAGFTYMNGPCLGDVDLDGDVEIGVMGVDNTTQIASINLYTYDGYSFGAGGVHWATFQGDNQHTGVYDPWYPDDDDDDDDDTSDDDDDTSDDDDDDTSDDDDDDNDDDDSDLPDGGDDDDDDSGCCG